jgi:hypothetical protein
MNEQTKFEIHNILYKYCKDFLNTQEITHAANEIIKDPTEETILNMTTYLNTFDTMRLGQSTLLPTSNTKALTANNIRFAMSEIRTLVAQQELSADDEDPLDDGNN